MLQWMKDSHTATQEQIKQQAEEAKAAEQRSREALLAIEKRAEAAAEDQKAAEQRHQEAPRAMEEKANKAEAAAKAEREALQQALQDSHTEFQKALENVAKQGHASTAAVIAGMQTPGDGTAFKDLVKLEKTYTDPDILRQFCLWENSAVDYMEAMGKKDTAPPSAPPGPYMQVN